MHEALVKEIGEDPPDNRAALPQRLCRRIFAEQQEEERKEEIISTAQM
jgi:hypothetical protein